MTLLSIIKEEFKAIFHDEGVLLLLIGALLIYSTLYGLIYSPEVVHKIPIAIVDNDNTTMSHQLQNMTAATSGADVLYNPTDLESAKALFLDRKISGILYIPEGYQNRILSSQQSHVSLYADGSYFLLYGDFTSNLSDVILTAGAQLKQESLIKLGLSPQQATATASPIDSKVETLFNPYKGYAASIMPAVLVVIIQQVLLLGIGMIMGTRREKNGWTKYRDQSTGMIFIGKTIVYLLIFIPLTFYIFGLDYHFFGYPENGLWWELALFLVPYLLSVIFLGFTLGALMPTREASVIYLVSLSIFFVMISGITWSPYVMPHWIYGLGQIFPSSSAVNGVTLIRSCGASLHDVLQQWITLWILTAIYGLTALLAISKTRNS